MEQTKFDCLSLLCAEKDETERETYRRFTDRIFFDLENWFNYIKASDFSFGGRFHGNVVSLILGRPALFFSLDNRISGMCDYFKLPYMDFRRFDPRITLDELYERADFTKFNLSYKAKYIDFCDFCESNGISGDMLQMVYPKPIQQPDKQAFLSMNDSVPTLSVIVPAYGTEMYLEKCLRSLMTQSLDSIEIIVVNDGSSGNAEEIIHRLQEEDQRVIYACHDHNRGLFHARLTGIDMAKGKYIAFVDSDDYVDPDYFRSMVCAAEANDADLVASRIVEENENGNKIEYNLCNIGEWDLRGEKIIEPFMDQAGRNFWWHAIWNKIVSRDLISKCRAHYDAIEEHLIMGEDLVYSIVFFSYAKHFISTEIRGYFYLKNQSASTSLRGNVVKFRKNIGDLNQVFTFCEQFLKNVELFSKYETQYIEWKARYSRYWVTNVLIAALSKRERTDLLIYIKTAFNQEQSIESREEDHYFYSIRTEFDERYLNVKKWIIKESRNIRYVSFDLFDTMVTRPFYEPSDLFVLLNKYYQKLYNSRGLFDFSTIRKSAEADLRKRQSIQRPSYQEITIAEIYLAISETLRVAPSSLSTLMQKEMDLEESFCTPRKSIKELFELVKDLGLKLICITDTYLPREVIERI